MSKDEKTLPESEKNNVITDHPEGETEQPQRTPEKKEIDTLSFLQAERDRLQKQFDDKNIEHKSLLTQADKARDELLRLAGSAKTLDDLIARTKEATQ